MDADEIFQHIGSLGKFQIKIFFLMGVPIVISSMQTLAVVFTMATQAFRCAIPDEPDDTFLIQGIHHQELINTSIPAKVEDGEILYSKCTYYMQEFNSSSHIKDVTSSYSNMNLSQPKAENACYKWVYDTSIFELTVVSEMDLVCDKKMYRAHSSMMYMVGYLVGVISMGILSDKIGRKSSYFICLVLITISAIITAWVPNFLLYVVLQLLTGFADAGLFISFYSLVIELVGPSKRAMMGAATHIMWVVGITLLCGIAFFIRHWRHLKMAISFPFVPFLVVWWFIPESPRWLMSKGRYDEANVILKQMATFNGRKMPEMVHMSLKPEEKKTQIWHIFSTCGMAVRTIIVFLNWPAMVNNYTSCDWKIWSSSRICNNLHLYFRIVSHSDSKLSPGC